MVLVTLEGLDLVYRHLQQQCRSSSSLVILVAADVDALAACRIFCVISPWLTDLFTDAIKI
jgi:hypothetical protein